MSRLEEIITSDQKIRSIVVEILESGESLGIAQPRSFTYDYEYLAVYAISKKDWQLTKQHFFTSGYMALIAVDVFGSDMFSYALGSEAFPLLSDNEQLIKGYAKGTYGKRGKMNSMPEDVEAGKGGVWVYAVQQFMLNNTSEIERVLNILELKGLKNLRRNEQELRFDYEFYKALFARDKAKMEEVLEALTSKKVHKKRQPSAIMAEYISYPAVGYAKLAWRAGIEVECSSPYVPKELLPIEPLAEYKIEYDFLKEFIETGTIQNIEL